MVFGQWFGGTESTIETNILNNMVVNAVTRSVTDCFAEVDAAQSFQLTQSGSYPSMVDGADSPCTYCQGILDEIYTARLELEAKANSIDSGYTSILLGEGEAGTLSNPIITAMTSGAFSGTGVTAIGPCEGMCNSVIVNNISQSGMFSANNSCTVSSDVTTDIQQTLQAEIESSLTTERDIFGTLGNAFTKDDNDVKTSISTTLAQTINTNFIQGLYNRIESLQSITINDSNSIFVTDVSQGIRADQVGSLTAVNTVVNELRQSATYSIAQILTNKNDTISDLADIVIDVINASLDSIGSIIIAGVLVACIVAVGAFLCLSIMYLTSPTMRGKVEEYATHLDADKIQAVMARVSTRDKEWLKKKAEQVRSDPRTSRVLNKARSVFR